MTSIDVVSKAIKFECPEWLPLELVDVPGIYNAYGTLDLDSFDVPHGAQDFDSAWATYHWSFERLGLNSQDEVMRKDEWGCIQRIPHEQTSAYVVESHPLIDSTDLSGYRFPDPSITDGFFEGIARVIHQRYPERFISAYIHPGPFLIACNLLGYEEFLYRIAADIGFVKELVQGIIDYQKQIVVRWKNSGAHMINVIDEVAGSSGMMLSPQVWRREFRPMLEDFFSFVHDQGMFTCMLLDGDVEVLFDDLLDMPLDVIEFAQPLATGLDKIAAKFAGKKCIKASVDMMDTLISGSPEDVAGEAHEMVRLFHSKKGGFIAVALRWHRPEYPAANVKASIEAFNMYRTTRSGVG